jgi:phosphoenolpyruvate synthase/pyruvate phosphate dikinase
MVTAHQLHFEQVFRAMDHRPVAVRLLIMPLAELFPRPLSGDDCGSAFREAVSEMADRLGLRAETCERDILLLQGDNGRRLSVLYPEMVIMQTKAIIGNLWLFLVESCRNGFPGAALQVRSEGIEVRPCVLLPLATTSQEANYVCSLVRNTWAKACEDAGHSVNYFEWSVGALVKDPRACLVADRLLQTPHLDFLAVCSDELTELVFGAADSDTHQLMVG